MPRKIVAVALWMFVSFMLTLSFRVEGQELKCRKDSVDLFQGRVKLVLRKGELKAINTQQLQDEFFASFDTLQLLNANGFKISAGSSLRFYQTTINKPIVDDGGVGIWNLIHLFTGKMAQGDWLESGWKKMSSDFLYFVKIESQEIPKQYFEFAFFYVDNKFSFSLFQCELLPFQDNRAGINQNYYVSVIPN